jgi:hypothetical protein
VGSIAAIVGGAMIPEVIECEECGVYSVVRGYGRMTFTWEKYFDGSILPELQTIRLTIDCPRCGVRAQEYAPAIDRCQTEQEAVER